jgi:hypothetical protein
MPRIDQDQLAFPVLIEVSGTSGSGFYLHDNGGIYLVTAKHVLFRKSLETYTDPVTLTSLDRETGQKVIFQLDCRKLMDDGLLTKHPSADVAVCKIATLQEVGELHMGRLKKFSMVKLPGVPTEMEALLEACRVTKLFGLIKSTWAMKYAVRISHIACRRCIV